MLCGSLLQVRYLWLIVTGDEPQPVKLDTEAPKEAPMLAIWKAEKKEWLDWSLRDQAAQGLMKGAAEPSQWPHVATSKTSKEMWDTWRRLYVTNQQKLNVHYYFEELYTTQYVDGTSMADHIATMLGLGLKIEAAGKNISDIHFVHWRAVSTCIHSQQLCCFVVLLPLTDTSSPDPGTVFPALLGIS